MAKISTHWGCQQSDSRKRHRQFVHPGQRRRRHRLQAVIVRLLPDPRKVFVLVTSDDRVPPLWLVRIIQRTTCGLAITLRVPEQRCVPSCRFSAVERLNKFPEEQPPLTTTCSRRVVGVRRHLQGTSSFDRLVYSQFIEACARPISPCTRAAVLTVRMHQATRNSCSHPAPS